MHRVAQTPPVAALVSRSLVCVSVWMRVCVLCGNGRTDRGPLRGGELTCTVSGNYILNRVHVGATWRIHFGWMNRRRFSLQKGGSQEHISLITIMFCFNKFALRLVISTHVYFAKNIAYFLFNSWLSFSDCVVFYGDMIFILSKIKNLNFTSGTNMHHCAKFNQNRSKGCRCMVI